MTIFLVLVLTISNKILLYNVLSPSINKTKLNCRQLTSTLDNVNEYQNLDSCHVGGSWICRVLVRLYYYSVRNSYVAGPVCLKGNLELMSRGFATQSPTSTISPVPRKYMHKVLFGFSPRNDINCRQLSRLHLKRAAIRKPDAG